MTKAERIYEETRLQCRRSIKTWGYRVNPDGRSVGFNSVFNEGIGTISTRTLNDMEKLLNRDRNRINFDRRYGFGTDAGNTQKEQICNMIESTIQNARESLKH